MPTIVDTIGSWPAGVIDTWVPTANGPCRATRSIEVSQRGHRSRSLSTAQIASGLTAVSAVYSCTHIAVTLLAAATSLNNVWTDYLRTDCFARGKPDRRMGSVRKRRGVAWGAFGPAFRGLRRGSIA